MARCLPPPPCHGAVGQWSGQAATSVGAHRSVSLTLKRVLPLPQDTEWKGGQLKRVGVKQSAAVMKQAGRAACAACAWLGGTGQGGPGVAVPPARQCSRPLPSKWCLPHMPFRLNCIQLPQPHPLSPSNPGRLSGAGRARARGGCTSQMAPCQTMKRRPTQRMRPVRLPCRQHPPAAAVASLRGCGNGQ